MSTSDGMSNVYNDWAIDRIVSDIKMARKLLQDADNKQLTHGEKHHIIQVVLMLLEEAQRQVSEDSIHVMERRDTSLDIKPSDIPF